jgi:hypothetical protein
MAALSGGAVALSSVPTTAALTLLLLEIHLCEFFHDIVEFLLLLLALDTVDFLWEFHLVGLAELDLGLGELLADLLYLLFLFLK